LIIELSVHFRNALLYFFQQLVNEVVIDFLRIFPAPSISPANLQTAARLTMRIVPPVRLQGAHRPGMPGGLAENASIRRYRALPSRSTCDCIERLPNTTAPHICRIFPLKALAMHAPELTEDS